MGNIYTQLSLEERTMIHTQLEMDLTPAAIAMGLHRSASMRSRELRRNGWTRPTTCRSPGRPPVAGGYRVDAAHIRTRGLHRHPAHCAPPATRNRIVGSGHPLPEGRLLARANYGYPGACARRHALVAGVSRNHLHRHLRHAAWRIADSRNPLVARRPCHTASPGARRRPAGTDSRQGQHA